MNGAHDMGGMHGFGPIMREDDEPPFHAAWEGRTLALSLAMAAAGGWTIDMGRHARERMAPADYLASSYYQIWLAGLQTLIEENGLATREEMASGVPDAPGAAVKTVLRADQVAGVLARGAPADRPAGGTPQKYRPGDGVRVRNFHPTGHTRAARYLRGHTGQIVRVHGFHVLPDASAAGRGDQPEWLYCVRFSARELWGEQANARDHVHADQWESYLEPA